MQFINIWMIVSTITAKLSYSLCQSQLLQNETLTYLNNYKSQIVQKDQNFTQKTEYTTSQNNSQISSREFFGDIFADCMKDFVPFSNTNTNCTKDGKVFIEEFHNQSIWAVKMYDSSAKYPGGVLFGEVAELGDFDQCVTASSGQFGIRGAYAVVDVRFRRADSRGSEPPPDFVKAHRDRSTRNVLTSGPESVLWAVCVPDSCTADDVGQSVERALKPKFRSRDVVVDVTAPPSLYTSRSTRMKSSVGGLALTYGILSIGAILAIVGTFYGLFEEKSELKNDGFFKKCIKSFSVIDNMKNLMSDSKNDEFTIVSGFKTSGLLGVIIGHRVALALAMPTISHEFSNYIYEDFSMGFLKTPVVVEAFFVISGFLTCIIIDGRLRSGKPLEFFKLLIYRFLRIIPSYITVLLIFANILPYIGDGPMWKLFVYPEAEFCRKNWWTNLLFINNYVNSYEMCMFHSWYLACDMHFFVVGTLLVYIIHRWKKVGHYVFCVLFLLSVYMPAKYIYDHKQWGVFPYFRSNMKDLRHTDHFHSVYVKSHFRITTYLIGIAAGYIYLRVKDSKFKFSVASRAVGCAVSLLVGLICYTLVTGYFYLPNVAYNPWDHILYFTVHRIIYASSMSYFIVVGTISSFGFVSSIFKNKFCIVVARLSYVGFLVHLIGQFQSFGQMRQPQYENSWTLFWKINADFTTTMLYTIPLNLIIESPSRNIFNHMSSNIQKNNKHLDLKTNETNTVLTEKPPVHEVWKP